MLTKAECNYDIYNRELLAMVEGLDHDRPLLAGTVLPIIIKTDHLCYVLSLSDYNTITIWWK